MVDLSKKTIIKILELIIVCILVILHYFSFSAGGKHSAMLTMGTFLGYLIILCGVFFGILMGQPLPQRLDLFFSVVGCVLFIVVGVLNLDYFSGLVYRDSFRDTGMAKGSISIVEGVLFIVDAVFAFKGQ